MIKNRAQHWMLFVAAIGLLACDNATNTPTAPSVATSFTFSSTFTSNGSATRSFSTGNLGTIAVTLTNVLPSVPLSIAVGIPRADGGGCSVTSAVEASAGSSPQLNVTADPGAYCVKVADTGRVRETATFTVTVTYP